MYGRMPKKCRVGRHENLFIFFLEDNKNCIVGTKNKVGRISGNTGIFWALTKCLLFYDITDRKKIVQIAGKLKLDLISTEKTLGYHAGKII